MTGRETIAGYSLIRPLGRGGMAEVWLGARTTVGGSTKMAAIKFVAAKHAGHEQYSRLFKREAELTSQLEHQNIVKVYDEGEEDGISFIAMEYVDGATVSQLEPKLLEVLGDDTRIKICTYVVQQALKALAFAHRVRSDKGHPLGIVHRDVSPDNILVSHSGEVKLTDWGVAFAGVMSDESSGQHVRGKPRYMAPEQLAGETRDPRVDIFAMGAVLQQLLDGCLFRGETPANRLHTEVLSGKRPPMRRAIPFHLEAILSKMLESDPGHRYESAQDVLDDLRRWPGFADMSEELGAVCRSLTGILAPRTRPSVSGPMDGAGAEPPTRRTRTPMPPRPGAETVAPPRDEQPPARPGAAPPVPVAALQATSVITPAVKGVVGLLTTTERLPPSPVPSPQPVATERLAERHWPPSSEPVRVDEELALAATRTAAVKRERGPRAWLRPALFVGASLVAIYVLAIGVSSLVLGRSRSDPSVSSVETASPSPAASESPLTVALAPTDVDLTAAPTTQPRSSEPGAAVSAGPLVEDGSVDLFADATKTASLPTSAAGAATPLVPLPSEPSAPAAAPDPAATVPAAGATSPSVDPVPKRTPKPRPAAKQDPAPAPGPPVLVHFRLAPDSGLTDVGVKLGKEEFAISPRYDARVPSGRHTVSWRASPTDPWRKSGAVTLDASISREWTMRVGKSGPKLEAFR